MLIVLLRLTCMEKFMSFNEVLGGVDATKKQIFDASQGALKNNAEEVINKQIQDRILSKVLNHKYISLDPEHNASDFDSFSTQ